MLQTRKLSSGFYRRLWSLSLPIALQNLITFSLGLMDTFMVSQLGNEEIAAVTAANVPVFIMTSIVFGVQSGLGILVSQYWGKNDCKNISRAIGVACAIGSGLSLVLALLCFFFPVPVMDLLSNRHDLSLLGAPYLKWIGFSFVCNMISSLYVSAQRSVENPYFGMKLFGFSTLLNTALNYLLIFGKYGFPALGVEGAAIATLLSRVAELVICILYALCCKTLPLDLKCFFHPGAAMAWRFVRYASPVVLNEAVWGFGTSMMTVILGYTHNSVEMLAANAVMGNLSRLFLVICFGFGAASGVIIGKAIGEGQSHDAVHSLGQRLLLFTTVVGAGLGAISLLLVPTVLTPYVFPLFRLYGESAGIATAMAVVSFVLTPFHAYTISAITGVLRCGGDVAWSTFLDIGPQWLLAIPLTALVALVLRSNYWIIAIAIQSEAILKCPLCIWRIHTQKWIHDVTASPKEDL